MNLTLDLTWTIRPTSNWPCLCNITQIQDMLYDSHTKTHRKWYRNETMALNLHPTFAYYVHLPFTFIWKQLVKCKLYQPKLPLTMFTEQKPSWNGTVKDLPKTLQKGNNDLEPFTSQKYQMHLPLVINYLHL